MPAGIFTNGLGFAPYVLVTSGLTPVVPWSGYDPLRTVSDDPGFLDGLNSVAAIEIDQNRSGGPRSELGGSAAKYVPYAAYTGLDQEPLRIVFSRARDVARDARPGAENRGRILLGASIDLDLNHRFRWADQSTGRTRFLYVDGASRNANEQNHHWVVDFVEFIA